MILGYYIAIAVVLGAWYAALRYWQRGVAADVTEGAKIEWDRLGRVDPDLLKGLDEPQFTQLYRRVEMPRGAFFTWLAVTIFFVGAPLILALNTAIIAFLERVGVIPQPVEQARTIRLSAEGIRIVSESDLETLQYILQGWGGFFSFFSLLFFWVAVFYIVMRQHHKRRLSSLRDEILRAR